MIHCFSDVENVFMKAVKDVSIRVRVRTVWRCSNKFFEEVRRCANTQNSGHDKLVVAIRKAKGQRLYNWQSDCVYLFYNFLIPAHLKTRILRTTHDKSTEFSSLQAEIRLLAIDA